MNIKEAKQEVIDTVQAYLEKDDTGAYEIPIEKQRPILLMGPPGIGKTAIMEQVAKECGINLVSYTITHHTRQSAIGLPFIEKRIYGGREYEVTEYTMSEIVASIYEQIEKSGIQEGILFLDEINCVSETLAPTMLQFLQYKTFGTHKVPDGFVIVTAGNPPEYNKSVRDLDIVTLDRVKRIDVEPDFSVWKEYAYSAGVHGSILAYLGIRKENFYSVRTDVDERRFVTARGWEDLSRMMQVYEKLGKPVTEKLVVQYLQDPEIARDFATYYELYCKYRNVYRVPDILDGQVPEGTDSLKNAPFDEKLSLIGLLIGSLNQEFRAYRENLEVQRSLFGRLKKILAQMQGTEPVKGTSQTELSVEEAGTAQVAKTGHLQAKDRSQISSVEREIVSAKAELAKKTAAGLLDRAGIRICRLEILALEELSRNLTLGGTVAAAHPKTASPAAASSSADLAGADSTADAQTADDAASIRAWFGAREEKRRGEIEQTGAHLTNSFRFLDATWGEGQEMVIFLSELAGDPEAMKFVRECGNEAYYKYNKLLLLRDQRRELQADIQALLHL